MITTLALARTARATAIICCTPRPSVRSARLGSTLMPSSDSSCLACACMPGKSMSPNRLRGSWPRNRFCATDIDGTRLTSWYTVLMPAACASSGRPNATGSPSSSSSPASGW